MRGRTSTFAFMIFLAGSAVAASPEDLLRSAWKDSRMDFHANALTTVKESRSYNILDKADFRFDRGELNQNDLQFGVRLYPKGYTEIKTTIAFQQALEKNEVASHAETLSRLLSERYEILARVALLKEKKVIADELAKVSRKANRMLSYGAQKDRTELRSFLKNKTDLDKIDIKIGDIQRDYKNLQVELKDLALGPIESFELRDFANMDDLVQRLDNVEMEKTEKTLSAKVAELDLAKSSAGMAYERAKDDKWFDHIEVSVKEDKIDERIDRVYGLELSFNLPFLAAPNLSRIDNETKELRDRSKLIGVLQAADRAFKNGVMELKTLLAVHKNLREAQSRMTAEQMLKASRAIAPQDPTLAVELQRGWYESREQMLDLEYRIRSLYILFLHESSTIANEPDKNYLSKNLKRIL